VGDDPLLVLVRQFVGRDQGGAFAQFGRHDLGIGIKRPAQPVGAAARLHVGLGHGGFDQVETTLETGDQHLFLVLEVVVDRRLGDAKLAGHVAHLRRIVAARAEQRRGGAQHCLALLPAFAITLLRPRKGRVATGLG